MGSWGSGGVRGMGLKGLAPRGEGDLWLQHPYLNQSGVIPEIYRVANSLGAGMFGPFERSSGL